MFGLELGSRQDVRRTQNRIISTTGLSPPSSNCPVISSFSPGHFDGKSCRTILTTDLVQVFWDISQNLSLNHTPGQFLFGINFLKLQMIFLIRKQVIRISQAARVLCCLLRANCWMDCPTILAGKWRLNTRPQYMRRVVVVDWWYL